MSRYLTPLRYPGGKQKISAFIAEVMSLNGLSGGHYVEPFAGGAGVALELLISKVASKITLNDSSRPVFAFWEAAVKETDRLCRRIAKVTLSVDEWKKQREVYRRPDEHDDFDIGFSFFYLNRCNRSGIASGGVIGGLDQTGDWKMDARFPRTELIRRLQIIGGKSDCISVKNLDAEVFIGRHLVKDSKSKFVYFDPPYFQKADRLYVNHYQPEDHTRIAKLIQSKVAVPWIVSYDNAPEIAAAYRRCQTFTYSLQYSAATSYKGTELFVFSKGLQIPSTSAVSCIASALPLTEKSPRRGNRSVQRI